MDTQEAKLRLPATPITPRQVYGLAAVLLVGLYMLLWWNRALSANSIGNSDAQDFLGGKFPYRDFYVFTTPINLLVKSALLWTFGDYIAVLRSYGVIERLVIVGLTYYWVSRRFSPFSSFLGCVVMGVGCSGDTAETLFHYNFQAILLALIAGLSTDTVLAEHRSQNGAFQLAAISGFFACLVFFAKQPTGLGISGALFLFLVLIYRDKSGHSRPLLIGFSFIAGWLVPLAGFAGWLYSNHALAACIDQTLISGPTAKGPLWSIVFRPILLTFSSLTLLVAFASAVVLLVAAYLFQARRGESAIPAWTGARSEKLFWVTPLLAIAAGALLSLIPGPGYESHALNSISFIFIYLCQLLSLGATLWYLYRWLRGQLKHNETGLWFATTFCTTLLYTFSISYPVFEIMFIPVLAFAVAYSLDQARVREHGTVFGVVCAMCLALITVEVCHRFISLYDWDIWADSSVWTATKEPRIPQLRGLYLDPRNADFLDQVTNDIVKHSGTIDPVLVFPSFPLFYSTSGRRPNTFSQTHFTDTTSDRLAISDGLRIAASPPKVVVLIETDEGRFGIQEKMYRAGTKTSGQRKLRDQIREMTKSYQLIDTLAIPGSGIPVKVFVRN